MKYEEEQCDALANKTKQEMTPEVKSAATDDGNDTRTYISSGLVAEHRKKIGKVTYKPSVPCWESIARRKDSQSGITTVMTVTAGPTSIARNFSG